MIAVVGYASIDRTLRVDRLPTAGVTSLVLDDLGGGAQRPGGVGHTVLALAAAGAEVAAVTAVGADDAGRVFVDGLVAAGADAAGVTTLDGSSPRSSLLHDDEGDTACLFEPGVPWSMLAAGQIDLVASADVVVVMIGPLAVGYETLEHCRDDALLAWIVKNDPSSLQAELAERLSARADLVFHNVSERHLVGPGRTERVVVCTDGAQPVTVTTAAVTVGYEIPPVPDVATNPTGAGDSFSGAFLAAWLAAPDPRDAVAAGAAAARERVTR